MAPNAGGWSSLSNGSKLVIIGAVVVGLLFVYTVGTTVESSDPRPHAPEEAESPGGGGPSDDMAQYACDRLAQLASEVSRGLVTEDEAYDKLRDIHGDAAASSDPRVARAIESAMRLHTQGGGDQAAALAELRAACLG